MTYKGKKIGIPTIAQIQECIDQWKLRVSAKETYDYWASKNWLTKKGQPVKTLEAVCNVANGIFIQRERKGDNISKNEAKLTIIRDYFESKADLTIKCLEFLKAANPLLFTEAYYELAKLGFTIKHTNVSSQP